MRNVKPTTRARVLVIDDDEIALQAIADLLEEAGYEVHSMVSPIGATQVIVAKNIQAAVVDLNMPVMRGDRFISLVRSWDRIRDLPLVLISGASNKTLEEIGSHLPGVQIVPKEHLHEGLANALSRAFTAQRLAKK